MKFGPLRQHILQLAISGQLVEQLDSEPAVEQVGPAPKPDEVPFELPPKWKWVQAGYLGNWKSGQTPSRTNQSFWNQGTVPWLKSGEITDGLISEIGEKVTELAVNECNLRLNSPGSVVVAIYGATAGKVGITQDFCVTNQACCVCKVNSEQAINWYLLYSLLAIREMLLSKTAGSAQPNLSKEKVIATWIPVPPIEEQHRIVAKVDALLDRLEKMEAAYSEFAGPMTEHFRNLVLNKAIRGELVPQLDSEPEVEQVGPAPKPDEVPFELPHKWKWVQLNDVAQYNPRVQAEDEFEVSFVPLEDLSFGFETELRFNQSKPWSQVKKGYKRFQDGDVIFAKIHPSFQNRKSGLVTNAYNGMGCGSTEFCVYRCAPQLLNKYLLWFFKTDYFINFGKRTFKGTVGQQRVNLDVINSMYIPLPPLEEQRRIVAKVEELLAGVKQLSSLMEYA